MRYTIILLLFSCAAWGQTNKRYVEEIALYHLDSLTKVSPVFKNFKYFTNGYLSDFQTGADTSDFKYIRPNLFIKSSFKNLKIIEDPRVVSFAVPGRIRRNGSSSDLVISRYIKIKDKYLVHFSVKRDNYSGQSALMIMDSIGNLIGFNYYTWIE